MVGRGGFAEWFVVVLICCCGQICGRSGWIFVVCWVGFAMGVICNGSRWVYGGFDLLLWANLRCVTMDCCGLLSGFAVG